MYIIVYYEWKWALNEVLQCTPTFVYCFTPPPFSLSLSFFLSPFCPFSLFSLPQVKWALNEVFLYTPTFAYCFSLYLYLARFSSFPHSPPSPSPSQSLLLCIIHSRAEDDISLPKEQMAQLRDVLTSQFFNSVKEVCVHKAALLGRVLSDIETWHLSVYVC